MHQTLEFRGSLRVRLAPYALAAVLMPAALLAVGSQAGPPRPKGSASEAITTAEGKALADWTLARPEVAARLKGHRTRLLRASVGDAGKDGKTQRAVLFFRDYDSGQAFQALVNLDTGLVELKDLGGLIQPSREEIAEGMAIVTRDRGLASFVADPGLRLMGGFHNRSPYADDPCSRETCLEFAFMKPGPSARKLSEAEKTPPRRVIVNLSRGAVVNRDYRANADPSAPLPRMTAVGEEQ